MPTQGVGMLMWTFLMNIIIENANTTTLDRIIIFAFGTDSIIFSPGIVHPTKSRVCRSHHRG